MVRKFTFVTGCLAAFLAALIVAAASGTSAQAESKKMIVAAPGIPPIFASVILYVAEKQGFWKKYGAEVDVKPFDTGTAAARAVLTGDIEIALAPTPLVISQISNVNANVVSIYGFPSPDWILATTDATKTSCKDLAGQSVGVTLVDCPTDHRSLPACGRRP